MLRESFAVCLVVLLVFLYVQPCFAKGPTISVGAAAGMQDEIISIPVRIEGNPGINTFSLGFKYDQSKLTLMDVTPSSKLGGQFMYTKKAVWFNSKDTKHNGDILFLKFRINDTALSSVTEVGVTYSPGDISNYNEKNINCFLSSGAVIVGAKQQTLEQFQVCIRYIIKMLKSMLFIK